VAPAGSSVSVAPTISATPTASVTPAIPELPSPIILALLVVLVTAALALTMKRLKLGKVSQLNLRVSSKARSKFLL
jgi:hypothetical protein